jgi:hypothetical protein
MFFNQPKEKKTFQAIIIADDYEKKFQPLTQDIPKVYPTL